MNLGLLIPKSFFTLMKLPFILLRGVSGTKIRSKFMNMAKRKAILLVIVKIHLEAFGNEVRRDKS